jgi:hypothetical protein
MSPIVYEVGFPLEAPWQLYASFALRNVANNGFCTWIAELNPANRLGCYHRNKELGRQYKTCDTYLGCFTFVNYFELMINIPIFGFVLAMDHLFVLHPKFWL